MSVELLPEFAIVPAGDFAMGSDAGDPDERPVHRVHVDEFRIGVHQVTHDEYARFVRATGRRSPAIYELPLVVRAGGPERERTFRTAGEPYVWVNSTPPADRLHHPVTLVRWIDAVDYCQWLSSASGKTVRLPTEAEWERAARGGLEGKRYPWGDRLNRTEANYLVDPAERTMGGTTVCRSYSPNPYGLFDMAGNVWEWVQDWYAADYYMASAPRNPRGPANGTLRLVRGGSWLVSDVRMLSCSYRHKVPPDTYSYAIGFRIVCPSG